MKKSMIGLSILAVGLLSACQKDDVTTPEKGGNVDKAYASLTIDFGAKTAPQAPLMRSISETNSVGNDFEQKFTRVDFGSSQTTAQTWTDETSTGGSALFGALPAKFTKAAGSGDFEGTYTLNKPFQATAGPQEMALAINFKNMPSNSLLQSDKGKIVKQADTSEQFAKVYNYFVDKDAGLSLTSEVQGGVVKPNVTSDEAASKNMFTFTLERTMCKGIVVKGATVASDNNRAIKIYGGEFSDLKYAPVNGATKNYVFRNNAGERTLGSNKQYNNFHSAIETAEPKLKSDEAVQQGLVRLGEIGDFADSGKAYAAKEVTTESGTAEEISKKADLGFYFCENNYRNKVNGNLTFEDDFRSKNGFWRMAYAKVYATYKPAKVYGFAEDGKTLVLKEAAKCAYLKNEYDGNTKDGSSSDAKLLKKGTFFVGANDGKLYETREAASVNNADGVFCYNGGRCGYRVLWNRVMDGKKTVCADTRRNNTYILTVGDILDLGFPYDPSDDKDPNLPKNPEDPTDNVPGGGSDGGTDEQDTYMTVTAKVLMWNVVTRDNVSLGGKN